MLALIKENLNRRLSVSEMADSIRVSPSRLRQLFREDTGTTPVRYLRNLRFQRAKELLETTLLSVKEIAAEAGLSSVSHFVRNFHETYGRTPGQHRKRSAQRRRNGQTERLGRSRKGQ